MFEIPTLPVINGLEMYDLVVHYNNGEHAIIHNVSSESRRDMARRIAEQICEDYDGIKVIGYTHISDF